MKNNNTPEWDRIFQIIRHYDFSSISAFARRIGLNRGENLYQIKRGNNRISRELADRISDHLPEVSKAWILTGEGKMFSKAETDPVLKQIAGIPFYQNFPVRRPPAQPDRFLYFSKEFISDADFAVPCRTDELYPLYKKDAVIFLRRYSLNNPILYGETYFIVTDYCRVFRIIRKSDREGELFLVSPNSEKYDTLTISIGDILEMYLIL